MNYLHSYWTTSTLSISILFLVINNMRIILSKHIPTKFLKHIPPEMPALVVRNIRRKMPDVIPQSF
jgi:hypothetical protein